MTVNGRRRLRYVSIGLAVLTVGLILILASQTLGIGTAVFNKPPPNAPKTNRPTTAEIDTYSVPPQLPKYLSITKFGVKSRVRALGLTADNQLRSPANVYDVGWYTASSKPGSNGAMLVDGHVSSWTTNGVFYHLKDLVAGDTIQIERGDGKVFSYQVVRKQVYDAANVDMAAALAPVDATHPGLNLITCTGNVIKGSNSFSKRLIVFTRQL
ncbi:MAG: class F sortase [Patescibacteria group bacterium]|nr:class F sortase [Patescibacteria group bacterium]